MLLEHLLCLFILPCKVGLAAAQDLSQLMSEQSSYQSWYSSASAALASAEAAAGGGGGGGGGGGLTSATTTTVVSSATARPNGGPNGAPAPVPTAQQGQSQSPQQTQTQTPLQTQPQPASTNGPTTVVPATAIPANMTSSTTASEGIPTDEPLKGNYTGMYRPRIHFSPPVGFMNDPNGLFKDSNGTWHMYYQYNPTALVAGNQHWGHATSPDLYTWTNEPIALFPPEADVGVFSGSAVVDSTNSSGFFPNTTDGVVAIYTLHYPDPNRREVQAIAYSTDNGRSFTPYGQVLDIGSPQFRDPKVIRYGDQWVMQLALAQEDTIQFYTSPNLKNWTHASNFTVPLPEKTHNGVIVEVECPNLAKLRVKDESGNSTGEEKWVLFVSINPGSPLGGSSTMYFVGEFDGRTFSVPNRTEPRYVDWNKDDYAGQVFYTGPSDVSNSTSNSTSTAPANSTSNSNSTSTSTSTAASASDAVFLGWANNWQYTNEVPTDTEGWRSAMTLPRDVWLVNDTLVQMPVDMGSVLGAQLASGTSGNNNDVEAGSGAGSNSSSTAQVAPRQVGGNATANGNPTTTGNTTATGNTTTAGNTTTTTTGNITTTPVKNDGAFLSANFSSTGAALLTLNITGLSSTTLGGSINWTFASDTGAELVQGGVVLDAVPWAWVDRNKTTAFTDPQGNYTSYFRVDCPLDGKSQLDVSVVLDRSVVETYLAGGTAVGTSVFYATQPITNLRVWAGGLPIGVGVSGSVREVVDAWKGRE